MSRLLNRILTPLKSTSKNRRKSLFDLPKSSFGEHKLILAVFGQGRVAGHAKTRLISVSFVVFRRGHVACHALKVSCYANARPISVILVVFAQGRVAHYDIIDSCCFSTRSRSLSCIESILLCERSPDVTSDVSDSCCFWTMSCSSLCERLWQVNVTTIAIP